MSAIHPNHANLESRDHTKRSQLARHPLTAVPSPQFLALARP